MQRQIFYIQPRLFAGQLSNAALVSSHLIMIQFHCLHFRPAHLHHDPKHKQFRDVRGEEQKKLIKIIIKTAFERD
jgi:hypothetical protein